MTATEGKIYEFGDFRLEARERRLIQGDKPVILQNKFPEALAELAVASKLYPGNVEAIGLIGYINARQGNKAAAQKALDELQTISRSKYVTPLAEALIRTGLGENDKAIQAWQRAGASHDSIAIYYLRDPEFTPLRSEPIFISWLGQFGIS